MAQARRRAPGAFPKPADPRSAPHRASGSGRPGPRAVHGPGRAPTPSRRLPALLVRRRAVLPVHAIAAPSRPCWARERCDPGGTHERSPKSRMARAHAGARTGTARRGGRPAVPGGRPPAGGPPRRRTQPCTAARAARHTARLAALPRRGHRAGGRSGGGTGERRSRRGAGRRRGRPRSPPHADRPARGRLHAHRRTATGSGGGAGTAEVPRRARPRSCPRTVRPFGPLRTAWGLPAFWSFPVIWFFRAVWFLSAIRFLRTVRPFPVIWFLRTVRRLRIIRSFSIHWPHRSR